MHDKIGKCKNTGYTFFIDIGNNLVKQSNCPCDQCFNNGYGSCCCPNDKANEGKVENKAQEWQCRYQGYAIHNGRCMTQHEKE